MKRCMTLQVEQELAVWVRSEAVRRGCSASAFIRGILLRERDQAAPYTVTRRPGVVSVRELRRRSSR